MPDVALRGWTLAPGMTLLVYWATRGGFLG